MTEIARNTNESTATWTEAEIPEPLRQDATRHTLLGVDAEGNHHVWCAARERVVVINAAGIDHVEDLGEHDGRELVDWLDYVNERRGWATLQKRGPYIARTMGAAMEADR